MNKNGKFVICPICGKSKYFPKNRLERNARFCSKKCFNKSKKGVTPSNLEYARSKSPLQKGKCPFKFEGENHWAWQKENPSYRAVHAWIRKKYGKPDKCENKRCVYPRKDARGHLMVKPKAYQWANLSGKYRRDRKDFIKLCALCHKLFDLGKLKLDRVK